MRSAGFSVWKVEGQSVSIQLSSGAVREIEPLLGSSESDRPVERGGLLLGRMHQIEGGHVVTVEAFEELPCEHARGASWTLSGRDQRELAKRLRHDVVGWVRTHSRPGLFLDQYDYALCTDFFAHPAAVILVVRPDRTAGFFCWDAGDMQRARPYQTFRLEAPPMTEPEPAAAPEHGVGSKVVTMPPGQQPRPVTQRVPVTKDRRVAFLGAAIAAGLALGFLWNPSITRQRTALPEEPVQNARRPVLSPPEDPAPVTVEQPEPPPVTQQTPPTEVASIPNPEATPVQVRKVPMRKLVAPVASRARTVPEPVLDIEAPQIAATPARPERSLDFASATRRAPQRATATMEEARPSALRRAVGAIPGFGFLKRKQATDFTPPTPVAQVRPQAPAPLSEDVPVRVRVVVDESGEVASAELLSRKVDHAIAGTALDAAKGWRFKPARVEDKPVRSEMVLSFVFPSSGGI